VLRTFFTPEAMPDVHYSSFEVAAAVPAGEPGDRDLVGFEAQAEHVGKAVRAIVQRAIDERTPLLLEGVHLVPGVIDARLAERALVVQVLLAVEDPDLHRSHFVTRGGGARGPAARYLDSFDTIRKLQAHLIQLAEQTSVPVIVNRSLDSSLAELMSLVLDAVGDADRLAVARACAAPVVRPS
jgi:2-phosphoglycerate kinase